MPLTRQSCIWYPFQRLHYPLKTLSSTGRKGSGAGDTLAAMLKLKLQGARPRANPSPVIHLDESSGRWVGVLAQGTELHKIGWSGEIPPQVIETTGDRARPYQKPSDAPSPEEFKSGGQSKRCQCRS